MGVAVASTVAVVASVGTTVPVVAVVGVTETPGVGESTATSVPVASAVAVVVGVAVVATVTVSSGVGSRVGSGRRRRQTGVDEQERELLVGNFVGPLFDLGERLRIASLELSQPIADATQVGSLHVLGGELVSPGEVLVELESLDHVGGAELHNLVRLIADAQQSAQHQCFAVFGMTLQRCVQKGEGLCVIPGRQVEGSACAVGSWVFGEIAPGLRRGCRRHLQLFIGHVGAEQPAHAQGLQNAGDGERVVLGQCGHVLEPVDRRIARIPIAHAAEATCDQVFGPCFAVQGNHHVARRRCRCRGLAANLRERRFQ